MANPQKENGHTAIANELIEVLAKTYLSSYETQILFAIFRKTYGWQKKEDWITNTQLAEMTNIPKSHVSRTIKRLVKRKLITKKGKKLSFQKDHDQWEKLPKQVTNKKGEKSYLNRYQKLPKQVTENTQSGNKKLPEQVPTKEKKETYTKETITKEKGPVFKKTLSQFKKMRSKNKKKMTDYAVELLVKKLDNMTNDENEQIAIMNQSIENCWMGVYELKNKSRPIRSIKQQAQEIAERWEKEEREGGNYD
jgi:phage replication O-like protein O